MLTCSTMLDALDSSNSEEVVGDYKSTSDIVVLCEEESEAPSNLGDNELEMSTSSTSTSIKSLLSVLQAPKLLDLSRKYKILESIRNLKLLHPLILNQRV